MWIRNNTWQTHQHTYWFISPWQKAGECFGSQVLAFQIFSTQSLAHPYLKNKCSDFLPLRLLLGSLKIKTQVELGVLAEVKCIAWIWTGANMYWFEIVLVGWFVLMEGKSIAACSAYTFSINEGYGMDFVICMQIVTEAKLNCFDM